jgi:hypothetical protein
MSALLYTEGYHSPTPEEAAGKTLQQLFPRPAPDRCGDKFMVMHTRWTASVRVWMKHKSRDTSRDHLHRAQERSPWRVHVARPVYAVGRSLGVTPAGIKAFVALAESGELSETIITCIARADNVLGEMAKAWMRDSRRVASGAWELVDAELPAASDDARDWPLLAHISENSPDMVAYYQSREHFIADRQTVTRPGRFLLKFNPDMPDEEVKRLAERFIGKHGVATLHVSDRQEDFIRVYVDGPNSCMAGNLFYKGHIHPAAVLASGDIEVLWIERDDGVITARCLANKRTKKCTRIYGDDVRLLKAMSAAGYTQERRALAGCRILKIENRRDVRYDVVNYIMPYIDATIGVTQESMRYRELPGDDDYFMLAKDGDRDTFAGYRNKGLSGEPEEENQRICICTCCGRPVGEDDLVYVGDDEDTPVCHRCLNEHYVWSHREDCYIHEDDAATCERCEEVVHDSLMMRVFDYSIDPDVPVDVCMHCYNGNYTYVNTGITGHDRRGHVLSRLVIHCEDDGEDYYRPYVESRPEEFYYDETGALRLVGEEDEDEQAQG